MRDGGEAGIRTLGRGKPSPVFKTGAFDHSATSPKEGIIPKTAPKTNVILIFCHLTLSFNVTRLDLKTRVNFRRDRVVLETKLTNRLLLGEYLMQTQSLQQTQILATNKVIRNTYSLLALTLLFSAATAGIGILTNMAPLNPIITLVGYFGLLFATSRFSNSGLGLLFVFLLTGFMGLTLGPIINLYLSIPNGDQTVMMALGGTGAIFLGLSGYALTSRKNFSFMGGFIMAGVLVAFLAGLAAMFFSIPALALGVSAMFVLLMSAMILWQTSEMIHGGETNYILATVNLYVSIYNLFLSLLHLLGALGGSDD